MHDDRAAFAVGHHHCDARSNLESSPEAGLHVLEERTLFEQFRTACAGECLRVVDVEVHRGGGVPGLLDVFVGVLHTHLVRGVEHQFTAR